MIREINMFLIFSSALSIAQLIQATRLQTFQKVIF